ncbi:MAG: glycine cleavage system aminomethyltransferase GcvT [Chloroflexota bacterium]|nr:MAG: glycine cleavage system aminomethyltransferase GcvT [Chloroflexota bacterium]
MALRTPLYETHVRLGGRIVEFGGWELPVQYSSIIDEHRAVRSAAGLFDVSHLGRVEFRGPGALDSLQGLSTNDVSRLDVGQAQYGLMLNERGGIVDDIFVYRRADHYLVVVNAATRAKDLVWMARHLTRTEMVDRTFESATLGLQGPAAVGLLSPHCDVDVAALKRNGHAEAIVAGVPMLIARTGYTGERGIELFPSVAVAPAVFDLLLGFEGVKPCGLGARDTLRLEAGNRLYGQDMDEDTNALEAGLDWVVDFEKGEFVGRDALIGVREQGGPRRQLVGFEMADRAVARHGAAVSSDGQTVGQVTSGSFAPSLERVIGFAFVPPSLAPIGTEIAIDVRGRPSPARVVDTPFYRRPRTIRTRGEGD